MSNDLDESAQRDVVAWKNETELSRLMDVHGLYIRPAELRKWRPTVPTTGHIPGVANNLTCIATDGLLGWFLRDGTFPLQGHVTHFQWDNEVVSMVPYYDPVERRTKYFKQVRDSGCPKTLFALQRQKKVEEVDAKDVGKPPRRKKKKDLLSRAMEVLRGLQPKP